MLHCPLLVLLIHLATINTRPYILFANRKDIRLLELTDNKKRAATNIIVKNLEDAAALDYFLEESRVCWSEINREVIRCANIDPRVKGKVEKKNIVTSGLVKPEGLACDWIGNKIYWTDSDTKRIEVSGLSGLDTDRSVLIWSDLDLPRAISVAPEQGLMFWTDWGQYPRIERCGMNGDLDTRQVLVESDIVWPNGLTLDYQDKRLFWLEAKLGYIASTDWEGNNRKTIFVGDKQTLPQPFAITMASGALFWTDWETNSIYSYNISIDYVEKVKVRRKLSPMDIRVFEPTRQPQSSSPCTVDNGGCSHLCLAAPYPPHYSCKCPTGYKLVNSSTCATTNSAILLVAARDSIIKVSLDTPDYTDRVVSLNSVVNSIAIDYDPIEGRVYWTDLEDNHKQSIRSASLTSPHNETDVVTRDVDHPDGVAVDWMGRNLFWTDSGTDRIEVARLDGTSRRVVVSEELDEPRSIVLDLMHGWMFWSDWGKIPRIERAWLDGRAREVIIDTELVWPNGIAFDTDRQKLYWCDAKMDRIEMASVDGSERVVVSDKDLPHPFGFSLLGDFIYWTDWQDRNIQRAEKEGGSNRVIMVSHLDDLMGAKAVLTDPTTTTSACSPTQSPCSHLCLLTPPGPVCACPTGHELAQDNSSCVVPDAFLLYTRRDDIRRISIERETGEDILIPLKGVAEASALDYDRMDGRIYWSDIELKTISRAFLNGSSLEVVVEFGLDYPRGLAVDWLAGNLYWADAGTGRVEVARLDGSNRRVLVWRELDSPECLVLDLVGERVVWSSWGLDPVIELAGMDGGERQVIVQGAGRSTGLTVDMDRSFLYWTDQDMLTISMTSLLTPDSTVTTILSSGHPYALTLYSSTLYITDWKDHTVSRLTLPATSSSIPTVLQTGIDYVMDLVAYHSNPPTTTLPPSPCSNTTCSSLCLARDGMGMCGCPSHYSLLEDNTTCVGPTTFLLYSQKNKISRLLMLPQEKKVDEVPDIVLPIKRARSIQSVSYDQVEGMIYWVDHGRGEQPARQVIRRARDTGISDRVQMFDRQERFLPFDLAIDPFTRSLFWTCANTNTINVTRLGRELMPLGPILVGGTMDRPRFIAVHPGRQVLYVSMAGEFSGEEGGARLEKMVLGSGERSVLVNTSVGAITALTVDVEEEGQVYWADIINKRLEAIKDDIGGDRRVVVSEGVVEPVGLAIEDSWLYWADRDQAMVVRVDKITGTQRQVILSKVARLSSLTGVARLDLGKVRENPCYSSNSCSHFCSYLPTTGMTCSCPHGLSLAADGETCGLPPTCQATEFSCASRGVSGTGPACIPQQWRCDGQSECADRSDELDCPECGPHQFRCQSGQCVPSSVLCDGAMDCDDRSDEQLCCGETQFQCAVTGECVDREKLCDGDHDCGDSSDELLPKCSSILSHSPNTSPALCCPDPSSRRLGSEAATATTSFYLITVFASLISLFLLSLIVVYCMRKDLPSNTDPDSTRPLACSGPSTELVSAPAQLLQTERGRAVGGEQLTSGVSVMSPVGGSSNGLLYDRSHLTGASSTAGTSSSGPCAGAQCGPGPPPSPATSVGTKLSRLVPSNKQRRAAFNNAGMPTGYRYYTHRAAPPCTPCSTDINDESDSLAYSAFPHRPHFPSRAGSLVASRTGYDSETYGGEDFNTFSGGELPSLQERGRYAPPPTTPLYLSDYGEQEISPPPSPTTERSFFLNPCIPGPPPSPVPGPAPSHNQTME